MIRKWLYDGNDDDNGDDDDVTINFYKLEATKAQECFKKAFCCKLPCMKLLLVAHAAVPISDDIDCNVYNYVSKQWSCIYNSYKLAIDNV